MKNKAPSPLLERMMNKGGHNAPPQPLDPKRAELAAAITKTFINQSMADIKAALGQKPTQPAQQIVTSASGETK